MSRVGNSPILIPEGVNVQINPKDVVISGKLGSLTQTYDTISVEKKENQLLVSREMNNNEHKSKHGLYRSLFANMVIGVSQGFEKSLEIIGTGYKCDIKSKSELVLNLGYSNPINFKLPEGIDAEVANKGTILKIKGINNEVVGEIAARIRKLRKLERYKGKGVRYQGEYVKLKAGKAAGKGAK